MASDMVKNCKVLFGLSAYKCCYENLMATKRSTLVTWGTLICGCCLFFPISCFKLVFCRKLSWVSKLLSISSYQNYCRCSIFTSVCLLFPLCLAALSCMLPKMVLNLYVWVYNFLKVMIYPGGQLSQFVF